MTDEKDNKITILVVDDKEENIEAYERVKSEFPNLDLKYAHSKEEAFEILDKDAGDYDMVITDKEMENQYSGFEVFEKTFKLGLRTYIVTEIEHGGKHIIVGPKGEGNYQLNGAKKNPESVQRVLNVIMDDSSDESTQYSTALRSISRYQDHLGKNPDLADLGPKAFLGSFDDISDYESYKEKHDD